MVLIEKAAAGDILSISRLMSEVENDTPQGQRALDELYPRGGRAAIIGITGPSGSGKSTLVNRLALTLSSSPEGEAVKVGVIAVDPSSPFSGGALLGDRVRMRDLGTMPNIFIRSMATRGALGGLARAADEAVQVLDALGFEIILVETVGAGQSEVDIVRLAHTTVVVEAPGLGDDVQAAKAGILEIADVLVVNKADKPGADGTAHALEAMLAIGMELESAGGADETARWRVPLVKTCALDGAGVDDLCGSIRSHRDWLMAHGGWARKNEARVLEALERAARERLYSGWLEKLDALAYRQAVDEVMERRISPRQALDRLIA